MNAMKGYTMEAPFSIAHLLVYQDDTSPDLDVEKIFKVKNEIKTGRYRACAERIVKAMLRQHCETLPKLSTISVDKHCI